MMRAMKIFMQGLLATVLGLASFQALAHKGSDAYLDVQQAATPSSVSSPGTQDFSFSYSVAIKDLDLLLPVDANADGKLEFGEYLKLVETLAPKEATKGAAK